MCLFSEKWVCKQVLNDHNLLCSLQCKKHVDLFNPSSSKSSYQDLTEEERQKIKDLLFILEKFNVSESAYRELTVFCDG
jgi:hypothetical protein